MSTEEYKKIFSENLIYYLGLRGKSQADLYRYMNVSSATASDWCNGKKMPRMDKIQSICNWLDIEKSDLLTEKKSNHSLEFLKTTDLVNMYFNSVMHWTEENSLTEEQTCILRSHFYDLLLRYKKLIERFSYANLDWKHEEAMFSRFYKNRKQPQSQVEIKELYLKQELSNELEDLENWVKAFPNWIARNEQDINDNSFSAVAAHELPNATVEDKQYDDDIMDDENF